MNLTSSVRQALLLYIPLHAGCFYLWLWLWQGDDSMRRLGTDFLAFSAPLVTLLCLWLTFRHLQGRGRFFWRMILLAVLNYLLGDMVWFGYVLFDTPNGSHPFFLLYYLCLLGALFGKLYEKRGSYRIVRLLFDTLIVMTAAISLSWQFLIQPLLLNVTLTVAYPALDLGLLCGILALYFASKSALRPRVFSLFALGLLLFICGDSLYLYEGTHTAYVTGSWFDPLRTLGLLIIGLSGLFAVGDDRTPPKRTPQTITPLPPIDSIRLLLPYASLLVLFVVLVLHRGEVVAIVIGSAIALTLLLVRQILTLIENERLLQKLHQLNEKLEFKVEQRTAELSVKNAKLTEALLVKDDFMAAISHELRTPMHGILGYVELIENEEDGPISDELRADLQVIRRSANRLLRLIEDILNFSKIQNGKEQLKFEDVPIDELMEQIHEEMQVFAEEKRIAFVLRLPDPVGTVFTDPIKVEQILVNLVNNAIKFTDSGHVMISARRLPQVLELSVEDTGIGIERGHYEYIFEPFTQVDGGTTRKYNGTGLGLAIVRKLITLMQGEISLESEPGKGSRFIVRIPILE